MKKNIFVLALFCFLSMMANAEVAKYCMSYEDFVADNWKSLDELTAGRTKQVCQIKSGDHGVFYFKTGDKQSDKVLKKEAFAVMYGQQLFVNCRNLRNGNVSLETSKYVQAVRYDKDKLCLLAFKTDGVTAVAAFGTAAVGLFAGNTATRLGFTSTSIALGIANESLSNLKCYLLDGTVNQEGKNKITRINDEFMAELLADDAPLLERYHAIKAKHNRQSAANILPILMEKGLVKSVSN